MKNLNIAFLEVEKEDEEKISKVFPDAQIFSEVLNEDEIIEKCKDAEILCVFIYSKLSKKVFDSLNKLRFVVTRSVGYDHIDLATAKEKGIPVCNVPDYGAHVIAEHVFALLLSGLRRVAEGEERIEKNLTFDFHGLRGKALKGKTMGIVGAGKIGKNAARIASLGFLMDVIAHDPFQDEDAARENHFSYVPLEEIWEKSDIISLHCPLTEGTQHLVDSKTIAAMKDGVTIVNTSRGEVIETEALIEGVKKGKIAHVALDVLEHERSIEKNQELLEFPNVVITPHIAFYADDSMKKMYSEAIASIERFSKGEKLIHQVEGI